MAIWRQPPQPQQRVAKVPIFGWIPGLVSSFKRYYPIILAHFWQPPPKARQRIIKIPLTLQLLSPSGIATLEAIGDHTLVLEGTYLLPDGVATAEALGTLQANFGLLMSGIASAEAIGTSKIVFYLLPTGIATGETLDSPQVNYNLILAGIESGEAFGTIKILFYILPDGITTEETIGDHIITFILHVSPDGIATGEAIGDSKIFFYLLPSSITSLEALGTPVIPYVIQPLKRFIGSGNVSVDDYTLVDTFYLSKFTAEFTENVIQIWVESGGIIDVKVAMYEDNAGEPGDLMNAVDTAQTLAAGWNALGFSATSIILGTNYWLGLNSG